MVTHIHIISAPDDCIPGYTIVVKAPGVIIARDTFLTHAKRKEPDAIIIRTREEDVPALMNLISKEKVHNDHVAK